jgi:hypothetical protein
LAFGSVANGTGEALLTAPGASRRRLALKMARSFFGHGETMGKPWEDADFTKVNHRKTIEKP